MTVMDGMIFLADAFTEQVKAATHGQRFESKDLLIGTTIALAIGIAIFLAIYLRVRKKSHAADQERLSQMTQSQSSGSSSSGERHERRRKRRRRRDHRPRNPSLDKTGGLPPARPEDQLPNY
jgi:hypothetical protein